MNLAVAGNSWRKSKSNERDDENDGIIQLAAVAQLDNSASCFDANHGISHDACHETSQLCHLH